MQKNNDNQTDYNMLRYSLLLLLFLNIQVYNVKSGNEFYLEPVFFENSENDEYFIHTVERGEAVYGIAKIYRVPIDSIYKLNPGSEKGITVGQKLKIPQTSGSYIYHTILPKETLYSVSKRYFMTGEDILEVNPGLSVETFTAEKIIRIPINRVTQPVEGSNESALMRETNTLLNTVDKGVETKTVNVALLLPFEGSKDAGQKKRFVEYFEGFLLALDSLKKSGISINLQVHDIGQDTKELSKVLKNEEMKTTHLIIGGFTDNQIKTISNFSSTYNIPYVIPFTPKSDEPLYNSNAFQINTPHSHLYSKVSKLLCEKYKYYNIIFINDKNKDKEEFVQAVQADLRGAKIPFKTLSYNTTFNNDLKNMLSEEKNLIIPSNSSSETLMKIIVPLQTVNQTQPTKKVVLFGYPEWQRLRHEYLDKLFQANACIYSVYYTNNTSPSMKMFNSKFKKWYSKNMLDTYPKYGILGFDTGMFFIKAINQYGPAIYSNINNVKYNGIQTDFRFERINNWGGFINTNFYIIRFNPDYTITKDFQ